MRLIHHVLQIGDPAASLPFYRERLGMALIDQVDGAGPAAGERRFYLGFPGPGESPSPGSRPRLEWAATLLELRHTAGHGAARSAGHEPSREDGYWKIGITLADVGLARSRLTAAGVAVTEPRQFHDVGYLCHLADPDGHGIELLQHRFERHHRPARPDDSLPLATAPTLGQITLRIRDPDASLEFYRDLMGMRLLSRQIVEPHRFTLYFLGCTDKTPPDPDIDAVANREWLWQRPYTTLELQHVWGTEGTDFAYRVNDEGSAGFWGLGFVAGGLRPALTGLEDSGVTVAAGPSHDPWFDADAAVILDPDGYRIRLIDLTSAKS